MNTSLELWGGLECTLNRVGDSYFDQCTRSGHRERLSDLELFKDLGLRRLRYPCLWENVDWKWQDLRLRDLQHFGIQPILGLLHHGSGPASTNLLDPEFPRQFARYARTVAERYPWVEDYTPINEPLTTARFSGLYGHWYPHHRTDSSFLLATLNQVQAIVLAMAEIRKVQPRARLIQTEDMGRTQSTTRLRRQCTFDNHRRWLSLDLLCGRVDRKHPLYSYLVRHGASVATLQWIQNNPCAPDVVGINHYLLSNRFLDHRLGLYPPAYHGGNGRSRYADVGAVDCGQVDSPSAESVMREVWERYQLPLALTEVHTCGPREVQLRWLHELWTSARRLRADQVYMCAVTAWSLLGSYDWNSLCTRQEDFYEPGVFDLRSHEPRPTALVPALKALAQRGDFDHPVLDAPGYWRTAKRVRYAPKTRAHTSRRGETSFSRKILIVGARGTLGQAFARVCDARDLPYVLMGRPQVDMCDPRSVERVLDELKPWAVINAAGFVKIDLAETLPEICRQANVCGPLNLATACHKRGIGFVTFSSDQVFDGKSQSPYCESSPVAPLNVYGASKAECEQLVLSNYPESLVVRTSAFFGPWDEHNFVTRTLRLVEDKKPVEVLAAGSVSPTYVPDLVHASLDLLIDRQKGLVHLTNVGAVSWSEFARMAVKKAELDQHYIIDVRDLDLPAPRPRCSAMTSERLTLLPDLEGALARYFGELT